MTLPMYKRAQNQPTTQSSRLIVGNERPPGSPPSFCYTSPPAHENREGKKKREQRSERQTNASQAPANQLCKHTKGHTTQERLPSHDPPFWPRPTLNFCSHQDFVGPLLRHGPPFSPSRVVPRPQMTGPSTHVARDVHSPTTTWHLFSSMTRGGCPVHRIPPSHSRSRLKPCSPFRLTCLVRGISRGPRRRVGLPGSQSIMIDGRHMPARLRTGLLFAWLQR